MLGLSQLIAYLVAEKISPGKEELATWTHILWRELWWSLMIINMTGLGIIKQQSTHLIVFEGILRKY